MLIDTFLYEDQDGKQLYPQISITSKTIQSMSDNRITFAVVMSGAEIIVYSHVIVAKGRGKGGGVKLARSMDEVKMQKT